ncbi:MAG: hypothetical protein WC378_20625 [Opitutaceae bacterium]|jgi:hypothetical protein
MKRFLPALIALLLLGLLGCASAGNYMMVVPILDGQSVKIALARGGPKIVEDDDVKIYYNGFTVPEPMKVGYPFGFQMKSHAIPVKVRIEDVNGVTPELIIEDKAPKLNPQGRWLGNSIIAADIAGNMAWLNHDTNSMLVYRITIDFADGHSAILYQPSSIPAFFKPLLKIKLGIDKPVEGAAK